MNFQAVSVAQKDAKWGPGGYSDAAGTPSPELAEALAHTDASIGMLVAELQARGLEDSTLVIVTAKHGQSPIDHTKVARRDGDAIAALVNAAAPVAGHIEDDVALYWLSDGTTADAGAAALVAAPDDDSASDPEVAELFTPSMPGFATMFGDPASDPRTPDLIVQPHVGTIYSLSTKKQAEHGGFARDDAHVALLVSNPSLHAKTVHHHVRTKQVAPTMIAALGLDPDALDAVQLEGTRVLPDLGLEH
jgi:arylsulfatase A-like enzyme